LADPPEKPPHGTSTSTVPDRKTSMEERLEELASIQQEIIGQINSLELAFQDAVSKTRLKRELQAAKVHVKSYTDNKITSAIRGLKDQLMAKLDDRGGLLGTQDGTSAQTTPQGTNSTAVTPTGNKIARTGKKYWGRQALRYFVDSGAEEDSSEDISKATSTRKQTRKGDCSSKGGAPSHKRARKDSATDKESATPRKRRRLQTTPRGTKEKGKPATPATPTAQKRKQTPAMKK